MAQFVKSVDYICKCQNKFDYSALKNSCTPE